MSLKANALVCVLMEDDADLDTGRYLEGQVYFVSWSAGRDTRNFLCRALSRNDAPRRVEAFLRQAGAGNLSGRWGVYDLTTAHRRLGDAEVVEL